MIKLVLTRNTLPSSTSRVAFEPAVGFAASVAGREFVERKTGGLLVCARTVATNNKQERHAMMTIVGLAVFNLSLLYECREKWRGNYSQIVQKTTKAGDISAPSLYPARFCP